MAETHKKRNNLPKRMTTVEELRALRQEVQEIKAMLAEDYELSAWAKKALRAARKRPESQYVGLDEL